MKSIHVDIERNVSLVLRIYLQRSLGILDLISLLKWVNYQSSKRYLPSHSGILTDPESNGDGLSSKGNI